MTKINKVGLGIFSFAQALSAINFIGSLRTFILYKEQGYLLMFILFFALFGFIGKLISIIGCLFMHIRGLKKSLHTRTLMFIWYALPCISFANIFYSFIVRSGSIRYEVIIINGIMLLVSYAITISYIVDIVKMYKNPLIEIS